MQGSWKKRLASIRNLIYVTAPYTLFIMDPIRGVVFLSGTDFARNGISASLTDPNPVPYDGTNIEPNVLTAIQRTLTGITPEDKAEIDPNGYSDDRTWRFRFLQISLVPSNK